ncbi:protein tyrosine phosphatase [Actinocorallia herbida]|uniref:protein-tyrosine-phosphatase n=1 Tax=Actinocorallia herbida TaxID=58109 RepID=A0A3N1DA39_9ACTN|nr:low molecular weight protein-tyrosine-phosphatase [Actinocorallia herbida]ROO90395.1 protein tyrosine phosphatase [Actinocorallia herbida]
MAYRITFVCTGNICRSPMAEHVVRRRLAEEGLDVEVDSSGTGGWHVGDPADHRTVRTLARHGYTSAHSARQFSPAWFDRYDLIVALDEGHQRELHAMAPSAEAREKVRLLRSFDPQAVDLNVPDPYYGGGADFEECLELIEAAVPGLADEVRKA